MSTPRPSLLNSLPGPWVEQPSGLPPGGPRAWWRGPDGVVIGGPRSRIAEELAGWTRLGAHPSRPELLRIAEDGVLIHDLGGEVEDPVAVVTAWPRGAVWSARLSGAEALATLGGRTDPGRALATIGVKRKYIDRFLGKNIDVSTFIGPGLGGLAGCCAGPSTRRSWVTTRRPLHARSTPSRASRQGRSRMK